mgnify:CR=1 FL=1
MKELKVSYGDEQLLSFLKEDSREAFTLIYQKFWPSLYRSAFKRLKDENMSKDVIQNVFTDLWSRREELVIQNLSAYLHSAVRFQVFHQVAKKPDQAVLFTELEEILRSPLQSDSGLIDDELAKMLELWIMALPEKRRKIFLMHYFEELSTQEIADQLNISQKTVQNQLNTASTYIRARFAHLLTVSVLLSFVMKN